MKCRARFLPDARHQPREVADVVFEILAGRAHEIAAASDQRLDRGVEPDEFIDLVE